VAALNANDRIIVAVSARARPADTVRTWLGIPRRHWEGSTLVWRRRTATFRRRAVRHGVRVGQAVGVFTTDPRVLLKAATSWPSRRILNPVGEDIDAVVEMGFLLHPKGYVPDAHPLLDAP
jgi:hypothetical protein